MDDDTFSFLKSDDIFFQKIIYIPFLTIHFQKNFHSAILTLTHSLHNLKKKR